MKKVLTFTLMLTMVLFVNFCAKAGVNTPDGSTGNSSSGNKDTDIQGRTKVDPSKMGHLSIKIFENDTESGSTIGWTTLSADRWNIQPTWDLDKSKAILKYSFPVIDDPNTLLTMNTQYTNKVLVFYDSQGNTLDEVDSVKFISTPTDGEYVVKKDGSYTKPEYGTGETIRMILFFDDNGTPSYMEIISFCVS